MQFKPEQDGIDHINVYSKSRSQLGRLLSNFAHTPFALHGEKFESMESWWYWKKMNLINSISLFPVFTEEQLEDVKTKIGVEAKSYFRSTFNDNSELFSPTREELKEAYNQKLNEHPNIEKMLLENSLPITHYYMMWDKQVVADKTLWTATIWEEIKKERL